MPAPRLLHGDCIELMRDMPDASVDAVVCDPPYGIGFMGRKWDAPGLEWAHEWAAECLRVLKPGGHLVAFGATRTLHRLTVAVEDAGFEIRDVVHWVYWSGFPKSLDVSKAIDRMDVTYSLEERRRFTEWVRSTGITSAQIDAATGTNMGGHYTTAASQPAVMTRDHLEAVRHLLGYVPAWVEVEVDRRTVESENMKAREVLDIRRDVGGRAVSIVGRADAQDYAITAPATPEAAHWSGWGTALKPAVEPAVLARKPLEGTVAGNVLAHGTGALNIDGCRYAFGDLAWPGPQDVDDTRRPSRGGENGMLGSSTFKIRERKVEDQTINLAGRWPANLYACPKASRAEREAGCEGLAPGNAAIEHHGAGRKALDSPRAGAGRTAGGLGNHHPTVKPVALMRWLCRLVTPPGGVVLDPFMGSGTTGVACVAEGLSFIGCEREAEYIQIAAARIAHVSTHGIDAPEFAAPPEPEQVRLW